MRRTIQHIQIALTQVEQETSDLGLHINEGKTKRMIITSVPNTRATYNRIDRLNTIKIGECNLEIIETFSYLGSKITTDNSYDGNFRVRLLASDGAVAYIRTLNGC